MTSIYEAVAKARGALVVKTSPKLHGAKRALLCGRTLWVSPAMWDVVFADFDADPEGAAHLAEQVEVVTVESVKKEYRVAFAPD